MLASGISNDLSEQGQIERFGNMDGFRGPQRQVGNAEAADLVSARLSRHEADLSFPITSGQTEGCRQPEIRAVGTLAVGRLVLTIVFLIVVASKVGLSRDQSCS